ncbi:MAG: PEP-CTERM system TPR-repeat protein PrsT [Colwellia sp.]|nr:PEP-CTERM system TPR-repeat protein PrsT [Colwellia sp.]
MKLMKLAIVTSIALALTACGDNESAQSYLVKAKSHLSENQVNESIIALKNALKIEPKNGEVRFLLGQLYLSQGRGAEAVKELERSKKFKYSPSKVVPLLARAYILTDADDDVIALSKEADTLPVEVKSHYLAYKTLAALRSQNQELAQETVKSVKLLSSNSVYSFLAQGYLAFSQQKLEQAETLVGRVLSIKPLQPDALMLQGQIAVATKNFTQASTSFEQYLKVQPYSGLVQLLLADALLNAGEMDKAEQHADAILAKIANQPFANYIKAMVRFSKNDYQKASEHAEAALQANFKKIQLKLIAGSSAFQLKNYEQANHHLSAIVTYLPQDHVGRRMLAVSQLQLGLVDDISETLSGFEATSVEDSAFISSLSLQMFELGAVNQAKNLVKKSSTGNAPQDAMQSAREGILKLKMNDPSGMEDLKIAVKLNPELIEAELALAFAAVQIGDIDQAIAISQKWQNKYPNKPGGFNLLAAINIKQKHYEKAKVALSKSLAIQADNIFALTEMVKVEALLNNTEEANRRSAALVKSHPDNVRALTQYFSLNQNDSGLVLLKSAYDNDKTDVQIGVLYAEALMSLKQINESIDVLNSYTVDSKTPKKYWQLLYRATGALQKPEKLQKVLNDWRKINPYHIEPVILLADFYGIKREFSRAISLINTALEQHDNSLVLIVVKLNLLLNSQRVSEAKSLFNTIERDQLNPAFVDGIEGRIYLLEKNFPQAVPKLLSFYQVKPSHQNVIYLAAALQGTNETAGTMALLESHVDKFKGNDRVQALLASMYLNGQQDKALIIYQKIIETQPNNVMINNNLAWLHMENGELEKALFHAEAAYKLSSDNANVVDTYSQVLLKSGNKRQALEKAEAAYKLSDTKDVDIALNYIEVLIANSRKNEAKTLLTNTSTKNNAQQEKKSMLISQL